MSPTRKLTWAVAACLAFAIPAGCASHSQHSVHERPHSTIDPAVLAAMERQMVLESQEGGIRLGAADGLGRSLHRRHRMIALARHHGDTELLAGAENPDTE